MFSSRFFARKNLLKKGFPLFFVLCLVIGSALFSSCDWSGGTNENTGFIPAGTWSSTWVGNTGVDVYKIEGRNFTYTSTPTGVTASTWKGTIETAVDFVSGRSGVLIVKYTTPPSGEYSGHRDGFQYTGVYYKEYSSASIKMADAWQGISNRIEANTLDEARTLFTEAHEGSHVSQYGTYRP